MWNLDSAQRPEEVWKSALAFVLMELSADRAVVLVDEEGTGEFAALAARGIDPRAALEGEEVDLGLLRSAGRGRSPVAGVAEGEERSLICVPLCAKDGRVVALVYADRRQIYGTFQFEELRMAEVFAEQASARLQQLRPWPVAPAAPAAAAPAPAAPAPAAQAPQPAAPAAALATAPAPVPEVSPPEQEPSLAALSRAATAGIPLDLAAPRNAPGFDAPVPAAARYEAPAAAAVHPLEAPAPEPAPPGIAAPAPAEAASAYQAPPETPEPPKRRAPRISRISAPFDPQRPEGEGLARSNLVAGRFAVQREFLRCRFSTLLEAVDRTAGTPLVLRRLDADPSAGPEARRQILAEGRLLARLRHRNLPRVLEIVEDDSRIYLVLEEFSGRTLGELMAGAPQGLAPELVRRYLEQLLETLDYLHRQSPAIVHRDLQPDTLVVTEHGVLKLGEFGLARMQEPQAAEGPRSTAFRALGSACYGAPEQLMGDPSHPGNDLYSAGALGFFLASGQAPPPSVERAMGAQAAGSLRELRPDLDAGLTGLIDQLMSADPEARPRSAAEARMRLAQEEPAPPAPATSTPEDPGRPEAAARTSAPSAAPPGGLMQRLGARMAAWKVMLGGKTSPAPASSGNGGGVQFQVEAPAAPTVDLLSMQLDREVARTLPELVSRSIEGICIGLPGGGEMVVAVADPSHVYIYDNVSLSTRGQYRATLMKADPRLIELAHEYVYRASEVGGSIPWLEWLERKKLSAETLEVMNPMADIALGLDEITSPIVAAVDRIIKEAISAAASDIHLETYELGSEVRYRIDGVLHPIDNFPAKDASAMVKRLKVMANMDIAQERIPQGGRISLKVAGHELDLRVSIIPVPHGESVVMRLLKKGSFNLTLPDLGFSPYTLERYLHILSQPYGMILSCGPTGSGKSTTLYASLKEIQRPDRKLLTVEDPIEYQMAGICQVQVNNAPREEEKRVTFARVLREFLRQDPDVILVGEIRDTETAAIAVQAALTGHLLLSTIHTNDSVGIIARLRDMGIEQFLIGSTLLGGLAQRLARRICPDCREEIEVPEVARATFAAEGVSEPRMYHGVGCRSCHDTGYRGRVGLYELLEVTPEVRALVNRGVPEEEIRNVALSQGFRSLYTDGLAKAVEGRVTLEEVQRVCKTL